MDFPSFALGAGEPYVPDRRRRQELAFLETGVEENSFSALCELVDADPK
jgi:hypothetical protein